MGNPILPVKVQQLLLNQEVTLFGMNLDKNGTLGLVSLVGLFVAGIAQPIIGFISDKRSGISKRLPFILLGTIGMSASVLLFGVVNSMLGLTCVVVLVQIFGNLGQGPANALIKDHVGIRHHGVAAGSLNLSRVAGAGLVTLAVFLLMINFNEEHGKHWMWISLILMASTAILTTFWTVVSLWKNNVVSDLGSAGGKQLQQKEENSKISAEKYGVMLPNSAPSKTYFRYLIGLVFVIGAMSSLQIYAFFYLEDVIGLENPTRGGISVLLAIVIGTGLTVIPAGKLIDRTGHDRMLIVATFGGVITSTGLIVATSLLVVTFISFLLGITIGIFLTATWALANSLVSQKHTARELGYTSTAVFIGTGVSRIGGLGIDALNNIQPVLGYQIMLTMVAIGFVISCILMMKLRVS